MGRGEPLGIEGPVQMVDGGPERDEGSPEDGGTPVRGRNWKVESRRGPGESPGEWMVSEGQWWPKRQRAQSWGL